jgi:hypothetical protein
MIRIGLLMGVLALTTVARAADSPAELKERIEKLERALAELPAAQAALHDIENRVEALAREVDRLTRGKSEEPEVRKAIEALRTDLAELERRLNVASAPRERARASLRYDDGVVLDVEPVGLQVRAFGSVQVRLQGVLRTAPSPNSIGFELPHAQLGLRVGLSWIEVFSLFDFGVPFATLGGGAMVRDLYAEARPVSWLSVRAGQFRVPLGRQRLIWSQRQTFTDRSLATRALSYDRDIGAQLEGRFFGDRLLAQLAVTDGINAGPRLKNDNLDFAYTARIVAQPLGPMALVEGDRLRTRKPLLSFGAAFQYDLRPTELPPPSDDLDRNGRRDSVEVIAANVELAFKWRGLALEGEYFYRRERPGFGRPEAERHGVYAQASMMLWRGLELGARFSFAQFPYYLPQRIGILGDFPGSGFETGGVLNYYLWGERVKVQAAYAWRFDRALDQFDTARHEGHILELQVQAGF